MLASIHNLLRLDLRILCFAIGADMDLDTLNI